MVHAAQRSLNAALLHEVPHIRPDGADVGCDRELVIWIGIVALRPVQRGTGVDRDVAAGSVATRDQISMTSVL